MDITTALHSKPFTPRVETRREYESRMRSEYADAVALLAELRVSPWSERGILQAYAEAAFRVGRT